MNENGKLEKQDQKGDAEYTPSQSEHKFPTKMLLGVGVGGITILLILWWLRAIIIWGLTAVAVLAALTSLVFVGLAFYERSKKSEIERMRSVKDSGIALQYHLLP